ncbi:MAG: hypothetical protein CMP14_01995 [Rickettsiales bacterium]|nr:hypothetical protein [Rickettsiales bacterium]|tara:strand:+ start:703 stop:1443 length:741 start_codon:yes stop_codon:yes gene_type:complete
MIKIYNIPPKTATISALSYVGFILAIIFCVLFVGCGNGNSEEGGGGALSKEERFNAALKQIESTSAEEKVKGLNALTGLEEMAKTAISKITPLLADTEAEVRTTALSLVLLLKDTSPDVVAAINKMVDEDADENVQTTALHGLLTLGAHQDFLDRCKEAIAGSNTNKREQAYMYLMEAGEHAAGLQAELVAGLKDKDAAIRGYCATSLGNIGTAATDETKAALTALTKDKDEYPASAAKEALNKLK